jgi:multidomain signaling protein FimX
MTATPYPPYELKLSVNVAHSNTTIDDTIMPQTKLESALNALRAEYNTNLPRELQRIDLLWAQLHPQPTLAKMREFQRVIHKLSGNAGAFGFSALGNTAHNLDTLLSSLMNAVPLEAALSAQHNTIDEYLTTLKSLQLQPDEVSPPAAPTPPIGAGKLLYLVEDDTVFAQLLVTELCAYGYEIKIFNRIKGLPQAIQERPPAAIIMDVMLEEGRLAGPKVMFQIQKSRPMSLPLIFISARSDMEARLAAVRANGDAYFTKPFDISALAEKLHTLTQVQQERDYRILIVDDCTEYGEKYFKILQNAGIDTKLLNQPMRCLEVLEKFAADLVLINTRLLGFSGLELAMVIRQQEQYAQLPLIFFALQFEHSLNRAMLSGIGDDYLSENISPSQLINTLTNRIKNARQQQGRLQQLRNKDPLTELFNRHYFMTQLKQSGARAQRDKPLLLLYITLDNYWGVEKIQGMRASDALVVDVANFIKSGTHATDVVARLNESTFVLLSASRSLDEGRELAERIRSHLENQLTEIDDQRVLSTCSIGIGIHHDGSDNYQQVLSDGAHACGVAQKGGGNRIHLHESAQMVKINSERIAAVRQAIEQNNFILAFQPVTTLHGTPGAYYDALLRMRLLDKQENVPTEEFLTLAQQFGLMPAIDRWVVTQICQRLETHHRQNSPINFFVRISQPSVQDPAFSAWLRTHLSSLSFPLHTLIFDVSQNVALSALKSLEHFAETMCELGCRFALRDFDGRAGAIQLFKHLEINLIKLHHQLIHDISENKEKIAEMDHIVTLAHENGIAVVAPFVEDVTTLSLLWQHDLDYITGYFIQPPGENLDYDFEAM